MKNIFLTIIALSVIFSSCKKFLVINPELAVAQNTFYKSQSDFTQAVTGIYAPLRPIYNIDWQLTELRSDNTYFFFNVANRGSKPIEDLATFTIETNNATVLDCWRNSYLIIARANTVLSLIDAATFDQAAKDVLKGEAMFLRALAYYDLVRKFGDVPLFVNPATSYEETFKSRTAATAVYEQIISDVTFATTHLPSKTAQPIVGRATSGAAYALLADISVTLKKWSDAEAAARKILTMGYSLLPVYADIFKPSNKANNELIFQVNYVEATTQPLFSNFTYAFIPQLNNPAILTGVGPAARNGSGSFNVPTPEMLASYEDKTKDTRYSSSIGFYTGASPLVGIVYNQTPYIKKYLYPHAIPFQTNENWPIYRYAEILLVLAESLNEQGKLAEALVYVNMVRSRAGLDATVAADKQKLHDIILHERRIELAFENKRWYDLVRSGLAVSTKNEFGQKVKANPGNYYYATGNFPPPNTFNLTENSLLLPIPVSEIITNPQLKQNAGY